MAVLAVKIADHKMLPEGPDPEGGKRRIIGDEDDVVEQRRGGQNTVERVAIAPRAAVRRDDRAPG
jgi:hypothetical protein